MLTLVQEKEADALQQFCAQDVFGARISAFATAYGYAYPFALFWIQTINGRVSAAISKVDGAMTLCCTDFCDAQEITAFLHAVGYSSLLCAGEAVSLLGLPIRQEGPVLCADLEKLPQATLPEGTRISREPPLRAVFCLLSQCGQLDGAREMDWIADVSHRLRHGAARIAALFQGETLCACALCVAQTQTAGMIGAVAVLPERRGKGMGRFLVSLLTKELADMEKRVFLLREKDKNDRFYRCLGYAQIGVWAEAR